LVIARRPEGPWSGAKPVYAVPGLDLDRDYFTYAAKGHLHLSRQDELLVTYVINANNFWEMAALTLRYALALPMLSDQARWPILVH